MSDYVNLKYSIIRATPDDKRHEYLNVGVMIFYKDRVDLYITPHPERIFYAFNNAINQHMLDSLRIEIETFMKKHGDCEACIQMLKEKMVRRFVASDAIEEIVEKSSEAYSTLVTDLMHDYIDVDYIHKDTVLDGQLNVYSPMSINMDGYLIGTREGLSQIREAIEKSLVSNHGLASTSLVSSDGEGYQIYIMKTDSEKMLSLQDMYNSDMTLMDETLTSPEDLFHNRIQELRGKKKEDVKINKVRY